LFDLQGELSPPENTQQMPENTAQDRRSEGPLPASTYSVVERQQVEIPVEGKWPRGRRLLFLLGGALFLWAAIVALIRWL
jgi:hypothetical protein